VGSGAGPFDCASRDLYGDDHPAGRRDQHCL
jgi:hypothetical protein